MDYCSSCRRNLNGALVCPGCGDYAPDIAPPSYRRRASQVNPAAQVSAEAAESSWEAWPTMADPAAGAFPGAPHPGSVPVDDAAAGESEDGDGGTGDATAGGYEGAAPDGLGRAARRRQLARWKKYRRRAAAATALALVGGGLTASLLQNKPSAGHTQAAGSPHPESVGTPRTVNTGASSKEPDGHPSSRQHERRPSRAAGRQQPTVASTPPAAPATPRPTATHTAPRHTATPHAAPHVTSAPATAHDDHGGAAAPRVTPSPSTTRPGTDNPPATSTSPSSPGPTAPTADPTSPVCLLGVVCVG